MSQYLIFSLVNKNNPEITVNLGYWCTSIARELPSEYGVFPYTEIRKWLELRDLNKSINSIIESIHEIQLKKTKLENEYLEYKDTLCKAQSKEVCEHIQEMINNTKMCIEDYNDEIDTLQSIQQRLNTYAFILEENEEDWQLYYINC